MPPCAPCVACKHAWRLTVACTGSCKGSCEVRMAWPPPPWLWGMPPPTPPAPLYGPLRPLLSCPHLPHLPPPAPMTPRHDTPPPGGYETSQGRLVTILERMTKERERIPPEYLYYGIPSPWLQVRPPLPPPRGTGRAAGGHARPSSTQQRRPPARPPEGMAGVRCTRHAACVDQAPGWHCGAGRGAARGQRGGCMCIGRRAADG